MTIRQTREVLDKCILDYGTVDTVEDVREMTMHYPFKDHGAFPGPLTRPLIMFVRETNSAAAIINGRSPPKLGTYRIIVYELIGDISM